MANSNSSLTCSICLEVYKKPVTTSCGHSFCRECINQHWNKEEQEARQEGQGNPGGEPPGAAAEGGSGYSCPDCRHVTPQRPQLGNSVVLCSIIEDASMGSPTCKGPAQASEGEQSIDPQPLVHLQASPEKGTAALCPLHRRPLELYCIRDQRCICCKCSVRECRDHPKAMTDEQREEKEKILQESLLKTRALLQSTEEVISQTEAKTKTIQENSDKFEEGIADRFANVHRTLDECHVLAKEALKGVTRGALQQAESNMAQLQSEKDALVQHLQQAEQLLGCEDDVSFLQGFPLLSSPMAAVTLPVITFPMSEKVAPILDILPKVCKLLKEDLGNSLYTPPISIATKDSSVKKSPSVVKPEASRLPEGELRKSLLKNHRKLTFDPNTAHRYFKLSLQDRRVKHTTSMNDEKPDHPDRFLSWQVLACQSFQEGSHYWEVELSDEFAYIGIAYREIDRKKRNRQTSTIGHNRDSWSLQVQNNCHSAWHDGQKQKVEAPLYRRVGLNLDCSSGTLSFYGVGDTMELLHTFQCVFTAPVYPAFWVGEGAEVCLV